MTLLGRIKVESSETSALYAVQSGPQGRAVLRAVLQMQMQLPQHSDSNAVQDDRLQCRAGRSTRPHAAAEQVSHLCSLKDAG